MSDAAYATAVLHAAKHPTAVSGVLLGQRAETAVRITRALPMSHSALATFTAPLATMALMLAEEAAESRGERVVGVYFANELADDAGVGTVPTRLAEAVRDAFADACLLVVEAARLAPGVRGLRHCFRVCVRDEGDSTWARGALPDDALCVSKEALKRCDKAIVDSVLVQAVVDFEDHCLDPARDWFNSGLLPE